jgi:hypothetical protein
MDVKRFHTTAIRAAKLPVGGTNIRRSQSSPSSSSCPSAEIPHSFEKESILHIGWGFLISNELPPVTQWPLSLLF